MPWTTQRPCSQTCTWPAHHCQHPITTLMWVAWRFPRKSYPTFLKHQIWWLEVIRQGSNWKTPKFLGTLKELGWQTQSSLSTFKGRDFFDVFENLGFFQATWWMALTWCGLETSLSRCDSCSKVPISNTKNVSRASLPANQSRANCLFLVAIKKSQGFLTWLASCRWFDY